MPLFFWFVLLFVFMMLALLLPIVLRQQAQQKAQRKAADARHQQLIDRMEPADRARATAADKSTRRFSLWFPVVGLVAFSLVWRVFIFFWDSLEDFGDRLQLSPVNSEREFHFAVILTCAIACATWAFMLWRNTHGLSFGARLKRLGGYVLCMAGPFVFVGLLLNTATLALLTLTATSSRQISAVVIKTHHLHGKSGSSTLKADLLLADGRTATLRSHHSRGLLFSRPVANRVNGICELDELPTGLPLLLTVRTASYGFTVDKAETSRPCAASADGS